jgi:glycosyltransferase involved in cell wall biosynthesis
MDPILGGRQCDDSNNPSAVCLTWCRYRDGVHILVVHNRYRSTIPSGENAVVDNEIEGLRAAGHQVTPYLRSSDELAGMTLVSRLGHAGAPVHSRSAVRDLEAIVDQARPDVLHLHNPFPLVSTSVLPAIRRRGIPCVQTVHNHRHTCMKGTYQRDGHSCHDCLAAGHPGPGVLHACYRSSRPQSAVMAAALLRARRAYRVVDRFIALTPEIAASLREAGFDEDRIVLRPNSVPDPGPPTPVGSGFTFVGRISAEKGVLALAEAWLSSPDGALGVLRIVGDGPERNRLELMLGDRSDVALLGHLDRDGVHRAISASAAVVVPSLWPEAFPLVLLEAMAAGRALLVTDQGGLPTIVGSDVGRVVGTEVGSISQGLRAMAADVEGTAARGSSARRRYEERYHPVQAISDLVQIYKQVAGRVA